jgi:L-histidine Nalpha-methyltransferase
VNFSISMQLTASLDGIHTATTDDTTASSIALARDLVTGLSQPQKTLPCILFYDHRGSQLFEDVTRLPEYYPTRTETRVLHGVVGSACF